MLRYLKGPGLERLGGRGTKTRSVLVGIKGISLADEYRGRLKVGHRVAEFSLEPRSWVRFWMRIGHRQYFERALYQHADPASGSPRPAELPSNLRFAGSETGLFLVVDTRIDGVEHLPASVREIRHGFLEALGSRKKKLKATTKSRKTPASETVAAALSRLEWSEEGIVEQGEAWELRPRVHGEAVPVRLERTPGGLRLTRSMGAVPDGAPRTAVAMEALRRNRHLRFCRLVLDESQLSIESRLRADLIQPEWIAAAARAIATTWVRVRDAFKVLADKNNENVAMCYAKFFQS